MGESLADLFVRLTADTSGFKEPLDQAANQLQGFSDSAITIGAGLLTALPFAALGEGAFHAAESFEKATFQMRQATGSTGEALKGLEESFQNVFEKSGASAESIAAALSQLDIRSGLTGKALEALTVTNLQFAKVTGGDVKTSVIEAQKVFAQWTISTDQQTSSLDFLYKVTTSTGISAEKLMGTLQSAGPALRALGFSFQESAALIGNFEKHGLDAGNVIAVLTKGMATFASQGIKDPKAQLLLLIEQMQNAATSTEAVNMAVTNFSKRGAVVLSEAARSGAFDFAELTAKINANTDTVAKSASETRGWAGQWTIFKHELEIALNILGAPLLSALTTAVTSMKPVVAELGNLAKGFVDIPAPVRNFTLAFIGIASAAPLAIAAYTKIAAAIAGVGAAAATAALELAPFIAGALLIKGLYDLRDAMASAWHSSKELDTATSALASRLSALGINTSDLKAKFAAGAITEEQYRGGLIKLATAHGDLVKASLPVVRTQADITKQLEITAAQAKKTAEEIAKAFSALGTTDIPKAIKDVEAAYGLLARSGKLSVDQLAVAHAALNAKLQELSDKMPGVTVGYLAFGNAGTLARGSMQTLINAVADFNNHGTVFGRQLAYDSANLADLTRSTVLAKNGMTDLQMAMEAIGTVAVDTSLIQVDYGKQIQGSILETAAILKSVGLPSQQELRERVDESAAAYKRMQELQRAGTATQLDVDRTELQYLKDRIEANDKLSGAERAHYEQLKAQLDPLRAVDSAWKALGSDLQRVTNDMSRGLADAIVQSKSLADVFKKVGQDILTTILEVIIKKGIKVLLDQLASLGGILGKLGGIFGGVAGGSGGGPAPVQLPIDLPVGAGIDLGGAISKTTGQVGGQTTQAAGGIMSGTLGAVLGFAQLGVSIASGIVQGIQGAHMNNLLGEIEISTRQGKEAEQRIFDFQMKWLPELGKLTDIWRVMNDDLMGINGTLGQILNKTTTGATLNFAAGSIVVQGNSDPAKTADALIRKLKSLSPAFA